MRLESLHIAQGEMREIEGPVNIGHFKADGTDIYQFLPKRIKRFEAMQKKDLEETGTQKPLNHFYQYDSYLGINGDAHFGRTEIGDCTTIAASRLTFAPEARLDPKNISTTLRADNYIEFSTFFLRPPVEEMLVRYKELHPIYYANPHDTLPDQIQLNTPERYKEPLDKGEWGKDGCLLRGELHPNFSIAHELWGNKEYPRQILIHAPHIKEHYDPITIFPAPNTDAHQKNLGRNGRAEKEEKTLLDHPLFWDSWVYPDVKYFSDHEAGTDRTKSNECTSIDIARADGSTGIEGFDFVKIHALRGNRRDRNGCGSLHCGECDIDHFFSSILQTPYFLSAKYRINIGNLFGHRGSGMVLSSTGKADDPPLEIIIGSMQSVNPDMYGGKIHIGTPSSEQDSPPTANVDMRVKSANIPYTIEKCGKGTTRVFLDYEVSHGGLIVADEIHLQDRPESIKEHPLTLNGRVFINGRLAYPEGMIFNPDPPEQSKKRDGRGR